MRGSQCFIVVVLCVLGAHRVQAESMNEALADAYLSNPKLNAQRAKARGVDENIAIARGSFYPTASLQGNVGVYQYNTSQVGNQPANQFDLQGLVQQRSNSNSVVVPNVGALVVNMNIFNGFRSINGLNKAEGLIRQSRQFLRNEEMITLHAAAVAYMNLLRDSAILRLNKRYAQIMKKQVELTRERLETSNATLTDLYQAETALAQAKQASLVASVKLQESIATYRRQIGRDPGSVLAPAPVLAKVMPGTVAEAISRADADHPLTLAANYNVEVNELNVRMQEGQLLPKVDLNGYVGQQQYSIGGPSSQNTAFPGFPAQQTNFLQSSNQRLFAAGASVQLNMPLYEGGVVYAQVRQAKEGITEAQYLRELQIREIHQSIGSAWAVWKNAHPILAAAKVQVSKAEAAVGTMREEVLLGQRTTWDILNAQLTLVNARIALVNAQCNQVLSAYSLLAAEGQLSTMTLGISVPTYDVAEHYERVKYQWIGTEPWN